jgi:hypothetical protein
MAFVALIIGELEQTVLLELVVVSIVWIFQLVMFINTFVLSSFHCLLLEVSLISLCLHKLLRYFFTIGCSYSTLT